MEECQSAYRENFSTETALLKVKTDILDAIDKKRGYVSSNAIFKCHIWHCQPPSTSK